MEPLNIIYWVKFVLGIIAAVLCTVLRVNDIFTGIMTSIIVYLVGDRILRQIFIAKVSKPLDITKTGVGTYIITWIFFWALIYTLYSI